VRSKEVKEVRVAKFTMFGNNNRHFYFSIKTFVERRGEEGGEEGEVEAQHNIALA
jgi:hypothetical protein